MRIIRPITLLPFGIRYHHMRPLTLTRTMSPPHTMVRRTPRPILEVHRHHHHSMDSHPLFHTCRRPPPPLPLTQTAAAAAPATITTQWNRRTSPREVALPSRPHPQQRQRQRRQHQPFLPPRQSKRLRRFTKTKRNQHRSMTHTRIRNTTNTNNNTMLDMVPVVPLLLPPPPCLLPVPCCYLPPPPKWLPCPLLRSPCKCRTTTNNNNTKKQTWKPLLVLESLLRSPCKCRTTTNNNNTKKQTWKPLLVLESTARKKGFCISAVCRLLLHKIIVLSHPNPLPNLQAPLPQHEPQPPPPPPGRRRVHLLPCHPTAVVLLLQQRNRVVPNKTEPPFPHPNQERSNHGPTTRALLRHAIGRRRLLLWDVSRHLVVIIMIIIILEETTTGTTPNRNWNETAAPKIRSWRITNNDWKSILPHTCTNPLRHHPPTRNTTSAWTTMKKTTKTRFYKTRMTTVFTPKRVTMLQTSFPMRTISFKVLPQWVRDDKNYDNKKGYDTIRAMPGIPKEEGRATWHKRTRTWRMIGNRSGIKQPSREEERETQLHA